ncbi:MAG: hypothetical protein HY052_04390 [Proteobacteria bacterium]|nr:hypothetical protein [Pseudomonadota bacterium]
MSNVKSFEIEAFKAKLSTLAGAKTVDDAAFADAIYTAVSKFGIDEDQFRDAFGLTKGAVDRWTQRLNLPQPTVRPKILKWIREAL